MQRGNNKRTWGLDALMDNLLITVEQQPQSRQRSHSAAVSPPTPYRTSQLSHHNSLASSASTRSTQSRSSLFSTESSSTNATLPVTMYQVPHSYDDEPQSAPQPAPKPTQPTQRVINLSPTVCVQQQQPHFVVAAFGMTNVAHWLFDNVPPERESRWRIDSAECTLTYIPYSTPAPLIRLAERIGISAFVVIVSSITMLYQQLDVLTNSLRDTHSDKLWWRRLIIVYDQKQSDKIVQERQQILEDEVPKVLPHYGMTHTPAVMFVSSFGQHSAEYSLQCKQVLRELIDTSHRLGRWRPDEDEDDFLDARVIHLGPQGRTPVRSMTRYNR
ncbi:hypothetical protein BJV82DRAFT_601654 [Fennellomyces sp. T-0311]|nr:hypothetical protein BJV82DRAFT_601654 [Fennellomyces sp. T-0311]